MQIGKIFEGGLWFSDSVWLGNQHVFTASATAWSLSLTIRGTAALLIAGLTDNYRAAFKD